ncbi:hypothetical protein AB6A40_006254 [Gnathostoma spinigerum]|uniref:Myosin motor domain-containing protein n=1 Tax=Gnathostoma spinigerum TaxID=75299 RepID=A0ABD6ETG7_9BILA
MGGASGAKGHHRLVWAPNPKEGFVLGYLDDLGASKMTVKPVDGGGPIIVNYDEVCPAETNREHDVDDNCALMYLNEGTLLNNCRLRYNRQQIYTYVANILISINPYEQIPGLYTRSTIEKYKGKSLGTLPPHIFAIADNAYRDMKRSQLSQSIIVSGESGAGKTESQKYILKYLCESWGESAGLIEQRILETNPILEAFGNAKTLRNNNSSRFGKFVEVHFDSKLTVAGGHVSHYLLEKSRLCRQQSGERSFHVFYQLIAGASPSMINDLKLMPTDSFNYLRNGCSEFFADSTSKALISKKWSNSKFSGLQDDIVDDHNDFIRLQKSLFDIGFEKKEVDSIFQIIAAILHLGNIYFVENDEDCKQGNSHTGGCVVHPSSMQSMQVAATLLGLENDELQRGLVSRIMQPKFGSEVTTIIRVPLKPQEASAARDALAKAIYSRLFDAIVAQINKCIPFGDSVNCIGVLDIAGFEFFERNTFEQLCINYCNEKLQRFFNDRILRHEQNLYEKEKLNVKKIEYNDNTTCIELFENSPYGIWAILDEEARLPKPSAENFTRTLLQHLSSNKCFDKPRKSKVREHREMRDDEGFLVRHYAGAVCYETAEFLEKNNDALHVSLEVVMEKSR